MATDASTPPSKVHFVGSIGLDTVQDVFHACGTMLGERLERIPDGEPGGRRLWCSWQIPLLRASPFFTVANPGQGGAIFGALKLASGVQPDEVRFGELGYAREARASYQDFLDAKRKGELPAKTRFQVSIPTPFACLYGQFVPEAYPIAEKAYTEAMLREVAAICSAIPHQDLCIQWDVCFEMVIWDGGNKFWQWQMPGDKKTGIISRLKTISEPIPSDVELGFHLCYGDLDAQHFFNPKDAGAMVDIANAISSSIKRPIAYIHMPVPIDRSDDAFFKPFDNLSLAPGTEVFLGVVHAKDGVPGLRKRVDAARKHLSEFGIATECGIARARTPRVVHEILEICAAGTQAEQ